MKPRYIHYGSNKFNPLYFGSIRNHFIPWTKPSAESGLWASPLDDASFGWLQWCEENDFNTERYRSKSFIFELTDNANVLYIRNDHELKTFKKMDIFTSPHDILISIGLCPDFEKLVKLGYDAIEVHPTTYDIYNDLYGWDCDSILILNPNCIKTISE